MNPFLSTSRALSHLLGHAAHELRGPVAALYMSMQVLRSRLPEDDENRQLLLSMEEEIERIKLQLMGLTQMISPEETAEETSFSLRQFIRDHSVFKRVSMKWMVDDVILPFSKEEWVWMFSYLLSALHGEENTFFLQIEEKQLIFSQGKEGEGDLWDGKDYSFFTSLGRAFTLQIIRSFVGRHHCFLEVRKHNDALSFRLAL